jgi:hypothetical protein
LVSAYRDWGVERGLFGDRLAVLAYAIIAIRARQDEALYAGGIIRLEDMLRSFHVVPPRHLLPHCLTGWKSDDSGKVDNSVEGCRLKSAD